MTNDNAVLSDHSLSVASELLVNVARPELFIAIVAPIGVDGASVHQALYKSLMAVGYETSTIKVTSLMKGIPTGVKLEESPIERRYTSYIAFANRVREMLNIRKDKVAGNDSLAMLAVGAIMEARAFHTDSKTKPCAGRAYILDQFKRPEEIALLRRLYGRLFVQISVHATKDTRRENLKRLIKSSHPADNISDYSAEAEGLIRQDLSEENHAHGQRVRDTFPMADVIVDGNDRAKIEHDVDRFIRLLFGNNFITPTHDEYGMYIAKAAALRSADLSRQVGAAIFSEDGEVVTLGSNEVPKSGGGTFFEGDKPDLRDFVQGNDYNEQEKRGIVWEFVKRLDDAKCLTLPDHAGPFNDLASKVAFVLEGDSGPQLINARVMDLLEFGRQIHAEMNAICDAARLGKAIKGTTLFCTTFPCHMCAKLILGAGIRRVVYIEPYPKSYAEEMYSKLIAVDSSPVAGENRVHFQPFTGVAPFRYRDLFEKRRRKDSKGKAQEWMMDPKRPNLNLIVETYISLEPQVMVELARRLAAAELPLATEQQ